MKSLLDLTGINDYVEADELPSFPNETPMLPSPNHSDVRSKVRRPQNAFLLFSSLRRKELQRMFPGSNGSKMAQFLGEEWKALPATTKTFFFEKAKERKEEFLQEHPDYHFVRGPNKKKRQSRPRNYPNGRNFRAPANILPKNLFPDRPITHPRLVAAPLAPHCRSSWTVPIKAEYQPVVAQHVDQHVAQHDKTSGAAAVFPEGRPESRPEAPWSLGRAQRSPWAGPAAWSSGSGSESESEPTCPVWLDRTLAVPSGRSVPSCPARVDAPKILEPAPATHKRRSSAPGILDLEQRPVPSSAPERSLERSGEPSHVPWSPVPVSSDLPSASGPDPVPSVQSYSEHRGTLRSHWSEYPYLSPSAIADTTTPNRSGASHCGASYSGASHSGASHCGASYSGASHCGAIYSGANYNGDSSSGANYSGASHCGASYSGASHSGANYSGDSNSGASHSEANLVAGLSEAAIDECGAMFLVPGTGDLLCGYSQLALQDGGLWYLSPMT